MCFVEPYLGVTIPFSQSANAIELPTFDALCGPLRLCVKAFSMLENECSTQRRKGLQGSQRSFANDKGPRLLRPSA